MSAYFVDTSALAKRYIREMGSTWTRSWLHVSGGNQIFVSELIRVEMFSLLHRYKRMNLFSNASIGRMQNAFLNHFQSEYSVIALNEALITEAADLAAKHPLRALDSIQLTCGLVAAHSVN
ncbi:MAG: type II toxin-antitoxin system VapC family toxin [Anaerolineae bacterium]|nr:type II toxin-antitoxin system VapC family toxin [Anaerolineae bacterium]